MTTMQILLAVSIVLAIANAIIQALDLHTSSEAIKRGLGHEDNDNLAGLLNTAEEHAIKFRRLVWIKAFATVAGILPVGGVWWLLRLGMSEAAIAGVIVQIVLTIYYVRILRTNWKIYRGS